MKQEVDSIYTHSDSESHLIGTLSGFVLDMKN